MEAELAQAQAHAQDLQARCSRQDEAIQGLHDRVRGVHPPRLGRAAPNMTSQQNLTGLRD